MQQSAISNAISEMVNMQNELNIATNGSDWRAGVTLQGREIDWRRCIYMETAELIDSYPWKHWKSIDAPVDEENARVELVDIWHFILSLAIEMLDVEAAAVCLTNAQQQCQTVAADLTVMQQVAAHEAMMRVSLERDDDSQVYLTRLAETFFNACAVAALDFDQLYQIYMAKNVLNKFRQDHGYKEGSYIKEWNGKEDNVVMFEIIATMDIFSGETLYQQLKQQYGLL